ncbi:MAG: hypothetical protein JW827_02370, partial [Spirochaetes bacterium]|nr:hypothetical protein [Spirochaetota bacterium]
MRKMIFIIILIIMCVTGSVFGQYTPAVSSMHTAEAVVGRPSTYDESQNIVQILGDKIVLQISLGSADLVTNVSLFYRTPGMSAYQMTNFLPKPTGGATYAGSATIPPAHVELGNTGIYI